MPNRHIVFLHGWSGDETSYSKVPTPLQNDGYQVVELHLGKYTTGDDDLSIDDYAIAMEKAVNDPVNNIADINVFIFCCD